MLQPQPRRHWTWKSLRQSHVKEQCQRHDAPLRLLPGLAIAATCLSACAVTSTTPAPKSGPPTASPTPFQVAASTAALVASSTAAPTATPFQIVGVPPAGELYQGTYLGGVTGEEDDITPNDLRSYEETVGKTAAWVYFSDNWYRSHKFPMATATWIREAGSVPFIRLMMRGDSEENHAEPTLDRKSVV
jgi:hypothetical protein